MTILNKLNQVSPHAIVKLDSTASVNPAGAADSRKVLADSGKNMPGKEQHAKQEEDRKRELNQAVKNITGYVQNVTRELNFSIDEELGETVVTVLDEKSGEVIRQIPTEDMLELAKNIGQLKESGSKGVLLSEDA